MSFFEHSVSFEPTRQTLKGRCEQRWEPVLSDELSLLAQDAVAAVASDVRDLKSAKKSPFALCERALLFSYLSLFQPSMGWKDNATECLELAIQEVSRIPAKDQFTALYGGLAGVGWAVEHVCAVIDSTSESNVGDIEIESEQEEDLLGDIDAFILRHLEQSDWSGIYDLIGGLVGLGVYFLERLPRRSAIRGIKAVLARLEEQAEKLTPGITWFTPPELVPRRQVESYPDGYYNLGVAHGVPGVIQFLAGVVSSGIETARAQTMLLGATEWLLGQRRSPNSHYQFSTVVAPGRETLHSRLGWCYGDLGIAAVLHQIGLSTDHHDWHTAARAVLDHCLLLPRDRDHIADASLCHGAIGVAHILNRIYQIDRDNHYKEAATLWFRRGLEMRQVGKGIGGFLSYCPDQNPIWNPDPSFLSGGIGIALALVSAILPVEPTWDRLLLLSSRGEPNRTDERHML